jgi:hypothetical protein
MPRPRRHKDNAARQKAYRERVKERAIKPRSESPAGSVGTPGLDALVARVVAADAQAQR